MLVVFVLQQIDKKNSAHYRLQNFAIQKTKTNVM